MCSSDTPWRSVFRMVQPGEVTRAGWFASLEYRQGMRLLEMRVLRGNLNRSGLGLVGASIGIPGPVSEGGPSGA